LRKPVANALQKGGQSAGMMRLIGTGPSLPCNSPSGKSTSRSSLRKYGNTSSQPQPLAPFAAHAS